MIKEMGGSPQRLVDAYINNRLPGQPDLFTSVEQAQQPQQFTQTIQENAMLRQELEGLKETIRLLEIKVDKIKDYTTTEIEALNNMKVEAIFSEPNVTERIDLPPVSKKPKMKFDPAWFDEFNNRLNTGEALSLSNFAKEKGMDKGTLSKHFKKIRGGKTA
ncbi:MAG: hypothetical protein HQL06_16210 [Nitrospirae bacterium]|nr:hypothetical protein [Nitrospirota bacterium]